MLKNVRYALQRTLPIMAGFFPVGIAYGILMANAGFNALWTAFVCVCVMAGSLQFLMLDFFAGGVPMVSVAVMALLLNSRHIFYGLSFIDRFRGYGKSKYFMIYSLSDENYSLLCSYVPQEGTDEKTVSVLSSLFTISYWVIFSMLGNLAGALITFDTTGIDFALTALFTVILLDQLKAAKSPLPVLIALGASLLCILIFGAANFILPALALTVGALLLLRGRLELAEKEGV